MTSAYAFELCDLAFSWQKNTPATLDIPSLSLPLGKSLFIHGASGSGKSTLLNILSGVLVAQRGEVKLLGQPFSSLSNRKRDQIRSDHLGYIFQQFNLLPYLSVLENVLLPIKISALRRRGHSRHSIALIDEAKHWLTQLKVPENLFQEKISRLSVGQQQRVAAARALIGSPEIIIADEPTSSLDQKNVDNFMAVLVDQCSSIGSSLVFVSHDLNLVPYFDTSFALQTSPAGSDL